MTDLTTLLSPTAPSASPLAPTAPASVTGVPGMAAQFAQTLGDMLASTTSVVPSATIPAATPAATPALGPVALPHTAQPLPILGLVGPLPNGKLLATGITDRQALADDGNAVPAEPAVRFLANPAWRAAVVGAATPPRTSVPLRTALERAAAQVTTSAAAKPARGSTTASVAKSPREHTEDVSAFPEAATDGPVVLPSTPDGTASAPLPLPAVPLTTVPAPASAAPERVASEPDARQQGTVASVAGPAARPAVAMLPAPPMIAPAGPDLAAIVVAPPGRTPARSVQINATPPAVQEQALPALLPDPTASRTQGAAVPATEQDAASAPPRVSARAARALPSDQAILAALGALPNPGRDASPVQGAAPAIVPVPEVAATPIAPVASTTVRPPAIDAPSPQQPATAAPATATATAATAPLARVAATTADALAGRTAATAPDSPVRSETMPVRLDRSVVPPIAVSATPQPAAQVFAAALATAATWRDRPAAERTDPASPTPPLGFTTAVDLGSTTPVQPTGDAQRAPLDLTQDTGVQRMIDHIEVLRDGADSRDTRIRLVPDALGSVDVAVRQVGERIHVSFTAEHEATRALIADAQPRLTELAAERGVRIVGTSVATDANPGTSSSLQQGQAQAQSQSQSQPQSQNPSQSRPNAPQQPPRASTRAQRDTETPEDQRLA